MAPISLLSRQIPRSFGALPVVLVAAPGLLALAIVVAACGDDPAATDADTSTGGPIDITNAELTRRSGSCAEYVSRYAATATDARSGTMVSGSVAITLDGAACRIESNSLPNHDFQDGAAAFASPVAEIAASYEVPADPMMATGTTALGLQYDNAVFLNGVKLDLFAAACYGVGTEPLGQEKIGCFEDGQPWRYDPMFAGNDFGTDSHNAHTQPDGTYHYHGNPKALFDDSDPTMASPVIGFAADGFPIYGPYVDDGGTIRKVRSGYTLKVGDRVSQPGEGAFPGGQYDGTFRDDYEFTDAGDLDECNGMHRDGQYGYYVTDAFPWVMACFKGTPNASFQKATGNQGTPGGGPPMGM